LFDGARVDLLVVRVGEAGVIDRAVGQHGVQVAPVGVEALYG
jgi:hypothetical protein